MTVEPLEIQRCLWGDCQLDFTEAEALYEHITTAHIGRKSAGTLSLECHWQGCTSKATKRDHLTSHARVHINLKPHKCSICAKSFKRPQDLKKHEKIHTEEHHAHHRHSKAVTVAPTADLALSSSTGSATKARSGSVDTSSSATPVGNHVPTSIAGQGGPYAGAYSYPAFGFPHPMMYGLPGGGMHPHQPQLDLAQLVAYQQQLTAQQQAGFQVPAPNMSAFNPMAGYPSQAYPVGAGQNAYAQQMAFNPYGIAYPMYHPQMATQHAQQPMQSIYPSLPHAPTSASGGALYPSINSLSNNSGPRNSAEDHPSPARSSQSSSMHSPVPSNTASSTSVSPRTHATALSPPGLSYSPSPEQESEASFRSRGTKRDRGGFEDAAGQFLGDLRKKRYSASDDVGSQLDALSSFLLSSDTADHPPSLEPSRSNAGSESSHSDYSRQEVDSINELLISLGQTITADNGAGDHHHAAAPSYESTFAPVEAYNPSAAGHSLYPSLTKASVGAHHVPQGSMYPSIGGGIAHPGAFDYNSAVRLPKAAAAPTLTNDLKMPIYQSVARLGRAAPSAYSYRDNKESMDVDEEDALDSRKAYTSSLRSTSMDVPDSPASKSPSVSDGPRLPPISTSAGSSPSGPTTLPSISHLFRHEQSSSSSSLASLTMSSSSSTTSVSSSRTVYPSIDHSDKLNSPLSPHSNDWRPQSSGGTVDRLTSSVRSLGMRHEEQEEDELLEPKSEDSDEDEDFKHKRSRVESPVPISADESREQREKAAVIERRMFALRALIVYVNSTHRQKLLAAEWKTVKA